MSNCNFRMDSHKLYWHLDRVLKWQKGRRISPLHIDLGISTGCNESCKYCYGALQGRVGPKNYFNMPKDALLRFLKDAKDMDVRSVAFIGEGENTLNPALYDTLNYAKQINLDVSLATNGIAIKEDRIKDMLESLTWLRFNISAATPQSFANIHRVKPEVFFAVTENIKKVVSTKKKYNLPTTIGMQMVLLHENIGDVKPLACLGRDLGIDYLVVKPCSDTYDNRLNSDYDQYSKSQGLFRQAENFSTDDYKVIVKWQKMMHGGKKNYEVCHGTQFILAISANGNVFPCGHWFNIRKDEFLMGNIIEDSFKKIVDSQRYWDVQKKIQSVDVVKDCESNCRPHYINEFLCMSKKQPEHINFI